MKKDLNCIMQWSATTILIIGTLINSLGFYPIGPILLTIGGIIWFIVAVRWRVVSLMVNNGVIVLMSLIGFIYHYYSALISILG